MSIATKLGRMVTYNEGFSPELSHNHLGTWSTVITWQTKTIPYGPPYEGVLPRKSIDPLITWSYEIKWQTKTIISPLPQTYDHQTLQGGDCNEELPLIRSHDLLITGMASIDKFTQIFELEVTWGHFKLKHYSTITMIRVTKLVSVMAYYKELSHDHLGT